MQIEGVLVMVGGKIHVNRKLVEVTEKITQHKQSFLSFLIY